MSEHPELQQELEDEFTKMKQVLEERQKEVEKLQEELGRDKASAEQQQQQQRHATRAGGTSMTGESTTGKQTAFMPKTAAAVSGVHDTNTQQLANNTTSEENFIFGKKYEEEKNEDVNETLSNNRTSGDDHSSIEKSKEKEDLTLKALSIEILRTMYEQAERELKRMIELILPILKPFLTTGQKTLKQLRDALIDFVKKRKERESGGGEFAPEQ